MTQELQKTLWATADKLRDNMDAAEYKHVVLGPIFLKYISDKFEELQNRLKNDDLADPDDKDEYLSEFNLSKKCSLSKIFTPDI